ncbi:MAG: methyltransferase domain-containing protein [Verrucomicrobiota bacterium]|nr:methyltransferase domain-containing protein [Verrucomicrobiota bacterium]
MKKPTWYDIYGECSTQEKDPTLLAGRRLHQKSSEKLIIADLKQKLGLSQQDALLEIGCGTGNLLLPLSKFVSKAVGVDHPDLLKVAKFRDLAKKCKFYPGPWSECKIKTKFDKILIYSVVLCLENYGEVLAFIDKALLHLEVEGSLLVGDIPNSDKMKRFQKSKEYRAIQKRYQNAVKTNKIDEEKRDFIFSKAPGSTVEFDDANVLQLLKRYRSKGFDVYLLPQSPELPFGCTREDILITKR